MIVPVGEDPPVSTAASRIAPPGVAADDPLVDSASVAATTGVGGATGFGAAAAVTAVGVAGVAGVTGAGTVAGRAGVTAAGGVTGTAQSAIVRLVDPESEPPSRVSAEDHDEDAVTTPLPLGIGTASENELPGNDAMPCNVVTGPTVGLNTITHSGVFSPPFPFPYELKGAQ